MLLLACGGEPPPEEPQESHWTDGVYEGTVTTPMDTDVFASLLLRDDGSGLVLIDAFMGFFDGPVTVVSGSDTTLIISFHDGDGVEMLGDLSVSGDTLEGTWSYAVREHDLSGSIQLVFAAGDLPSEEEFFSACLFVPADFEVPYGFETDWCRVRMLTVDDALPDYEAVMSSAEMLRELSGGRWPSTDMTLEEDLSDLEMHQSEHENREAFTYTIVSLDEDSVLGCIYIMPPHPGSNIDAAVRFWLRQNLWERGLDTGFYDLLRNWIDADWPFGEVIYPGRERDGA